MYKQNSKRLGAIGLALTLLFQATIAWAAPSFSITGPLSVHKGAQYSYSIYLDTDGERLTAAQTVLSFDKQKLEGTAISNLNSRCSFFAPPDPSLGYGSTGTPFFYNDEKAVFACGFANPGYTTTESPGDLLATITFTPVTLTDTTTTLSFSDSLYRYIGTNISPGTDANLAVTVYNSTASANPTATPYPSPTPVNARTVTASDLNLIDVSTGSGNIVSSGSALPANLTPLPLLDSVPLDNTIPTPYALTPRPTLPPFIQQQLQTKEEGDILSLRSLRELLIPGASSADKTVVFINLLSTLLFFIILSFLLWRLFLLSRKNKIKIAHMRQVIDGEIAMLLGKTFKQNDAEQKEIKAKLDQVKQDAEREL